MLSLRRITGQKNDVDAFGNYSAESEPIWINLEHCERIVGSWPWQIVGAIRTVATVWEAAEKLLVK